ncbi:tripartite tricarboxylate transporter substrate binding protein [Pseudorhodoferax sp.]|uniref:tripartite tricarboxylate transporter substrate binding protein n=1 Tax=Pseudorhodoferax sp. TaxID=1993553 RepID=UPI002DD6662F|nr:tripartite tricarboxylate transporter substrate binding protein [Pseudorhodoferax sp.]
MNLQSNRLICTIAAAAALACGTASAAWPEKSITIVVPTSAGGANDAMARTIGQALAVELKQTVIVENKAGANGAIASEYVKRSAPDGYTLMLGYIATHAMNPALQKLRYDPVADFEPVAMVGSSATLMVASPKVKANNAKELVAQLKGSKEPGTYASAGNGTAPHFAAEMFKLSTGVEMLHVPYKGSAPAVNDTIAGQTQVMFPSLFTAMTFVKNGKLKALGVAGSKRSELLPDVPTLAEQGIAGLDVSQWYAMFAPAKTPAPILEQLNKVLNQILADKATIRKMVEHGAEVETMGLPQMRTFIAAEQVKWKKVVQTTGLKAD